MIYRNKLKKEQIIFKKELVCYPYIEEMMKIYNKFIKNNPDIDINTIHYKIDEWEEEEDNYGNGGGINRMFIIYKYIEETDNELNDRINKNEYEMIKTYSKKLQNLINEFNSNFFSNSNNSFTTISEISNIFINTIKKALPQEHESNIS